MLDFVPQGFTGQKEVFIVAYKEHSEYIKISHKREELGQFEKFVLWQNNEQGQRFAPLPVYDEADRVFIVTKEDYSFTVDLKGNYDREFNKIMWSDHVMQVDIVRPYLIGFLPNSIEIKNIFNPNRIV